MNEILLRVRQVRKELTTKEGIVADALLNEPSAVITRTITSYAQYISSSTATITRFCKRLGISGFSELRLSIAKTLSSDTSDACSNIDKMKLDYKSSSSEIVSSVITNAQSAISQLHRLSNVEKLEKAADIILSARHVMLCGLGTSALVARDMHRKLLRLGILSHFEEDMDVEKVQLAFLDSRDVLVVFSYSGIKQEVKSIVKLAKTNNIKVISITKLGDNPISQNSDIHIPVVPLEALAREGATVSRLQMLIIVDILFQLLINHRSGVFEKLIAAENNEGMAEQKET